MIPTDARKRLEEAIAYHRLVAKNQRGNLAHSIEYQKANPWAHQSGHSELKESIAFHERTAEALSELDRLQGGEGS